MEYALNNNKVIKFILIDHSLESNGGHHFDYSQRVLEAAKYLGYKTILLANSKFQTNAVNGVDVLIKKFDHNYWQYRNPLIKTFIKHLFYSQKISWLNFEALVFAKELKESLKNIDLEGGDLIFMPMLGASELIGVGIFSKLNLEMGLHWNFVFRRSFNLGFGLRSIFERRIISAALYKFTRCFRGASANFYTDTENLSSEYSKLGFSEFMTLPVPVSDGMKLKEKWDGVRPLRIVYLGDARDEKGYQFLPQLVAGVRDAGLTHLSILFFNQIYQVAAILNQ